MARRDQGVAKWHQKQFERSNENRFVSQRSETRRTKQLHIELRAKIIDKFWFDSLSFTEKEEVFRNWYFVYNTNYWYSDPEMAPLEGETKEDYCKRQTPGCKYTQRDMKLNKLLS